MDPLWFLVSMTYELLSVSVNTRVELLVIWVHFNPVVLKLNCVKIELFILAIDLCSFESTGIRTEPFISVYLT